MCVCPFRYEEAITSLVLRPLGFSAAFDYDGAVQRRLALGSNAGKIAEIEDLGYFVQARARR